MKKELIYLPTEKAYKTSTPLDSFKRDFEIYFFNLFNYLTKSVWYVDIDNLDEAFGNRFEFETFGSKYSELCLIKKKKGVYVFRHPNVMIADYENRGDLEKRIGFMDFSRSLTMRALNREYLKEHPDVKADNYLDYKGNSLNNEQWEAVRSLLPSNTARIEFTYMKGDFYLTDIVKDKPKNKVKKRVPGNFAKKNGSF
ncbi:MAG: hypothetical protein KAK00_08295 [Nanoarchaeota archaeon]|nr:hypothetical protein [Thermodesulfovibrionia bacterium]MCK5283381.1 hypothetical protein [Nanoarchaeota archaeon]